MINPEEHLSHDIPEVTLHATNIATCLDLVALEAEQIGLKFSAHIIRTGASAVRDAIALAIGTNDTEGDPKVH